MEENLKYRMYGLVPYNLSPIQQGIQFGHAVVQYSLHYFARKIFQDWGWTDKTFIILNGGTTNNTKDADGIHKGSLNKYLIELEKNNIVVATFYEPDLNDALTAVVFLADERVWDYEKYPPQRTRTSPEPDENGFISAVYITPESDEEYQERLGGAKNLFLRNFIYQFKLA